MIWADNCWVFQRQQRNIGVHGENDNIEELLDFDMEPKPESRWWTSTQKDDCTLKVGNRGQTWNLLFMERFSRDRKRSAKVWEIGADPTAYHADEVPQGLQPCVQHGFEWQCQMALERHNANKSTTVGDENPASNFQTENERRRKFGRIQEEALTNNASQMEEHGLGDHGREESENILKTAAWAACDGEVPVVQALRSFQGWRTWWRNRMPGA